MKKSLIAMAALAAVGAASAQSTSTLSGQVDFGIEKSCSTNPASTNTNICALNASNNRNGTTQITWNGSEDLGGGLKANFKVSTSFDATFNSGVAASSANPSNANIVSRNNPTPAVIGNNDMFVGLSGGFGEVRLGRTVNPVFSHQLTANGTKGVSGYEASGSTLSQVGVYVANQVLYLSPTMAGLQLQLSYAPKESAAAGTRNHMGVGLRYTAGPLVATVAVANSTNGSGAVNSGSGNTAVTGNTKNWTQLAAAYDFGMARVLFTFQDNGNATSSASDSAYVVGLTAPVGAHQFWAQYGIAEAATGSDARILSAGFKYNMSKRTLAYVSVGNRNNAAAGFTAQQAKGTGYGVGLHHTF